MLCAGTPGLGDIVSSKSMISAKLWCVHQTQQLGTLEVKLALLRALFAFWRLGFEPQPPLVSRELRATAVGTSILTS